MSIPLGVTIFEQRPPNQPRTVQYPRYVTEILDHAGLAWRQISPDTADPDPDAPPGYSLWDRTLAELSILVTVGEGRLSVDQGAAIRIFVERGGVWISIGGLCGIPSVLGVRPITPDYQGKWGSSFVTLGEGYLDPGDPGEPGDSAGPAHRIVEHLRQPLHGFGGLAVEPDGATVLARMLDKHHRPTARAAVTEHALGKGKAILIAPDVTGSVVRIQQGIAVTRDGVGASDGSGAIEDAVLKSDDGMVLDWELDRQPVPGVPGLRGFLEPVADQWRELLLRSIFHAADTRGVSLPVLWLYPRFHQAIAHVSFDTDLNKPDFGEHLLSLCEQADIQATWCVICPGYERPLIDRIRAAGHELAMHFDAMSPGLEWSWEQFHHQYQCLTELFGQPPTSNKNHYLRWEGDCDLYHWLERVGIQLDQSKGTSKSGEVGYPFGSCHPYFPIERDGRTLDVLELATPTQDLNVFVPYQTIEALADSVRRAHGVLHLLFHPEHTHKPEVTEAFGKAMARLRELDMPCWTASRISQWERARRQARWVISEAGGSETADATGGPVCLEVGESLPDATLLWLDTGGKAATPRASEDPADEFRIMRCWGFDFRATCTTLEQGRHTLSAADGRVSEPV